MYDARVPAEMTWNERKHVESMKGIVQIARGCVHAELKRFDGVDGRTDQRNSPTIGKYFHVILTTHAAIYDVG